MPAQQHPSPIVVCPLEFERSALEKAGIGDICELICCGPGGDQVARWADSVEIAPNQPVILAGLAGSIDPELPAGTAMIIDRVLDEPGQHDWTPKLTGAMSKPAVIMSTRAPVTSNLARRWFGENHDAGLIDLESARFAAAAEARGWNWGIVRGISDDFSTMMPDNVDQWVHDDGRTSFSAVMRSLVCRPALLTVLIDLRTSSNAAMTNVAELIRRLVASTEC